MPVARKALRLPIIFLAAFVFVSLTPEFLHQHDFDRAFMAYYRNPTPENSVALRDQRRINDCTNLSFNGVACARFDELRLRHLWPDPFDQQRC